MNTIVLILGAPNDAMGNLSQIAKDRLDHACNFYQANPDVRLVCTGGFGAHFNNTERPHYFYSRKYLIDKGVPDTAILDGPLSTNTIEDFKLSKELISQLNPDILVVITSDFHMQRAGILYRRFSDRAKVLFMPAPSSLSKAELIPLVEHETRAVKKLQEEMDEQ